MLAALISLPILPMVYRAKLRLEAGMMPNSLGTAPVKGLHSCPQPLVSQLPKEHLGSPSPGGHSPGESPVSQASSQEAWAEARRASFAAWR